MKDLQTVLDALEQWTDETPRCDLGALDAKIYEAIAIVRQMIQAEPVAYAKSISDELMNCVDRLGSEYDQVDPRVWKHLLVYAPKLDSEPLAEVGVSTFTWLADRPPSGTKLYAAPQAVPDPMTMMTDASIMQVAQGWREFDAPGGGNSVVYGACRAVLNKYRDLLAAIPKVAQQAEQVPSWLPLTPELLTSIEAGEFGAGGFWLATKGSSSAVYGAYEWQQGRNPHGFNDINGYRIAGAHDVTHVMSYATPSLPAAPKGAV